MLETMRDRPLSLAAKLLKPGIGLVLGGALRAPDMAARRRKLGMVGKLTQLMLPRGTQFSSESLGGVALERTHNARHSRPGTLLYLHGGGYCVGTPALYRNLSAHLARRSGLAVLTPDYRLAPEHPFPAAPEDALKVYRALLDQGQDPRQLIIGGDSAGGGLALACTLWAKADQLPLPAGLVLFSPFTDMRFTGASLRRCEGSEIVLNRRFMDECAASYLNGANPDDPLASPLQADLRGLPPLLIQATETEMLYDDAVRLAAAARAQGLRVQAENWPGLWHVWQVMAGTLPEAGLALDRAADFIQQHIAP